MAGFDTVNELCYHCKLCYNHCPYTHDHEWDVDYPALMRRHQIFSFNLLNTNKSLANVQIKIYPIVI